MHFNIAKYLKIAKHILKNIKLKKRDRNKKKLKKRCKKVFNSFFFLVIRFGLAI